MIDSITIEKVQSRKLDFIDSLRGIAALSIIIFHLVYIPQPSLPVPSVFIPLIEKGGYGVTLFFVISAFTLCLSIDNRKDESNKTIKFYLRRFFRIAPLFYFMLIVHLLNNYLSYNHLFSRKEILLNISFLYNFYPLGAESIVWAGWTIGVEMIFYLLLPLVFVKVRNFQTSVVFILISLLISHIYRYAIELSLTLDKKVVDKYLYISFINQLPVFAIGITCYFVYRYIYPKIKVNNKFLSVLWLLVFAMLFLSGVGQIGFLNKSYYLYYVAISFSALIIALAINSSKLIVNRITRFYGKISYSTYLVHPLIIYMLLPLWRKIYSQDLVPVYIKLSLCSLITIVVVTLISLFTYYFIEEPGIKLGKYLISKI